MNESSTSQGPRLLLAAGEVSGDTHAAALAEQLRQQAPDIELVGMGGPSMQAAGVQITHDVTHLALVGLTGAARHYLRFRGILHELIDELDARPPDAVVLIDFPGFNLQLAKAAHARGIRVIYYISPQIWAWGAGRMATLRQLVHEMLVVFQFEEQLYRDADVPVTWIGHPLLDQPTNDTPTDALRQALDLPEAQRTLALLPGSRQHEVEQHLPIMMQAAKRIAECWGPHQRLIAKSPSLPTDLYAPYLHDADTHLIHNQTNAALRVADLALVCSGTATLEAALTETPMVVLYRTGWLNAAIGRYLVRIPHIGLVNVVAGRKIVPELIQGEVTPQRLADTACQLLQEPQQMANLREALSQVRSQLGTPGAAERGARRILDIIRG